MKNRESAVLLRFPRLYSQCARSGLQGEAPRPEQGPALFVLRIYDLRQWRGETPRSRGALLVEAERFTVPYNSPDDESALFGRRRARGGGASGSLRRKAFGRRAGRRGFFPGRLRPRHPADFQGVLPFLPWPRENQ